MGKRRSVYLEDAFLDVESMAPVPRRSRTSSSNDDKSCCPSSASTSPLLLPHDGESFRRPSLRIYDSASDQGSNPTLLDPTFPSTASPFLQPLSLETSTPPLDANPDADILQGRLPSIISVEGYVAAFDELPQGARMTLRMLIVEWRQGKMPQGDIESFIRSVAWQFKTLDKWASAGGGSPADAAQLMTLEDMAELMGSACSLDMQRADSPEEGPTEDAEVPHKAAEQGRGGAHGEGAVRPTEEDMAEALGVVTSWGVMDSTRTERLAEVLVRRPTLQFLFLGNGWDPVAKSFRGKPDWHRAEACLGGKAKGDDRW